MLLLLLLLLQQEALSEVKPLWWVGRLAFAGRLGRNILCRLEQLIQSHRMCLSWHWRLPAACSGCHIWRCCDWGRSRGQPQIGLLGEGT